MPALKPYSKERLNQLKQPFKGLIEDLVKLAHELNLDVQISAGFRTPEEQAELYKKGRTTPGPKVTDAKPWQSMHQYRIAADLFFLTNNKADFTESLYKRLWDKAVEVGLDKQGLVWSGNWRGRMKETAHFQLGNPKWEDLYLELHKKPFKG